MIFFKFKKIFLNNVLLDKRHNKNLMLFQGILPDRIINFPTDKECFP